MLQGFAYLSRVYAWRLQSEPGSSPHVRMKVSGHGPLRSEFSVSQSALHSRCLLLEGSVSPAALWEGQRCQKQEESLTLGSALSLAKLRMNIVI